MKRGMKAASSAAAAVVLVGGGLYGWWNTDVFGQGSFCNEAIASDEISGVLDGQGRLSAATQYESKDPYGFRCTVQRTSKFVGGAQPSVGIDLTSDSVSAPFGSRLWKNPSALSYLKGDNAAGGASTTRAWLLLPSSCWEKFSSRQGAVPTVTVALRHGQATEGQLMGLAFSAAGHIAKSVGCPAPPRPDSIEFAAPSPANPSRQPKRTEADEVCGLKGFTLPRDALINAQLAPGTERATSTGARTWACDLDLEGPGGPQLGFALSQNPDVVAGVRRDTSPGGRYLKVLKCEEGAMFVTTTANDAYDDVALDAWEGTKGDKFGEVRAQLLESFADAAAADRGCDG
ncbi:hypothetical protein [Streptomyces sp. KLOTTS4A1]|uniref:hypothetical protein n=1 Tax=Streptomyces sp. KLOTTS4A1 TaxID=3390996 RepID=UPI0039F5C802